MVNLVCMFLTSTPVNVGLLHEQSPNMPYMNAGFDVYTSEYRAHFPGISKEVSECVLCEGEAQPFRSIRKINGTSWLGIIRMDYEAECICCLSVYVLRYLLIWYLQTC